MVYKVSKISILLYTDLLKNHKEDCANKCTNKVTKQGKHINSVEQSITMVLLGLHLIAIFGLCADHCQASTQHSHCELLDTVYRLDGAPVYPLY